MLERSIVAMPGGFLHQHDLRTLGKMLANMREPPNIDGRIKRELRTHMRCSVLIVELVTVAAGAVAYTKTCKI